MRRKIIVALSVIFALSLSVLCFASCTNGNATKPKYTVTFETDGGSEVEAQQVERGSKVTRPEDPTPCLHCRYGEAPHRAAPKG